MGRVRIAIALSSLAVVGAGVAVGMYLPWRHYPAEAAWRASDVEVTLPGVAAVGVSEAGAQALIAGLRLCRHVQLRERLDRCEPAPEDVPAGSLSWKADGHEATATFLDEDTVRIVYAAGSGFGGCDGRYVMRCPAGIPEQLANAPLGLRASDPALQGAPGTLRAHADMLSRIVREVPADTSWLDDLDALVAAGGEARFIVPAAGDALGWRVEGSTEAFMAAFRDVSIQRIPRTLLGDSFRWGSPQKSAMEVALGEGGWARIEALHPAEGARIEIGSGWMQVIYLSGGGGGDVPEPTPIWLGHWAGANGRMGTAVTSGGGARSGYIHEHLEARKEAETVERARYYDGGPAADCLPALAHLDVTGQEARFAKVFAELGADSCVAVRHHSSPPSQAWFVEIAAP